MAVVFHYADVGESVFIDLYRDDDKTRICGSKGDRLFQFFQIQSNEWIEDEAGFHMQMDFPVFHPIKIFVHESFEDISPTVKFDIIDAPEIPSDLPGIMANRTMPEADMQYASFALDRWKTMKTFGEMMGDDEMAFMLGYAEEKSGIGFAGVFHWDASDGLSRKDSGSSKLTEHKFGSRLGALVVQDHWIPFVATHGSDLCSVVDYGHMFELPSALLKKLCLQVFGRQRCIGHWVELHPEPGWCGFAAVDWILGKLATPVHARSSDEIQPRILQIQEIAGVDLWDQIWNIEQKCLSHKWKWVILLRQEFIITQISSPTVNILHAGGHEDAVLLKTRGKIASVLIAKGHQATESIGIAESLTKHMNGDLKQLTHQKDDQIYGGIVEKCKKSGIAISQAAQTAAAAKLQKFFRTKQQHKKGAVMNFRLQDVTFPGNASANPSGDHLRVQENWSILTRGIAIADHEELQETVNASRLVSTECCAALTLAEIKGSGPITSELVTVQVTDAFGNKALIRVFMTQLGSKKVTKVPPKDTEIKLSPVRALSFVVHKCLVDDQFWEALMKGPAKAILESLAVGPDLKISQIFSRRWTLKNRIVDKFEADAFGMLGLVENSDPKAWLARSGTGRCPVFITSKRNGEDISLDESHRIIWTGKSYKESMVQLSVVPDHSGIVFKPPNSFGVRVQSSRFASAWTEVKGSGAEVLSQVRSRFKYLIAGAPHGISGPSLEAWAAETKWQIRVFKKFQDGRFLIGSDSEKPDQRLSVNGHELLIIEHQDRKPPQRPLVAGMLKQSTDPLSINDPWQRLSKTASSPVAKQQGPWSNHRPTDVTMDGSSANGDPADQILKNQNERITSIEEKMQNLEAKFQEGQNANTAKFEKIESDISGIEPSLRNSLKEALTQQSVQLLSTFESLLKKSPRTKDLVREREDRSRSPTSHR